MLVAQQLSPIRPSFCVDSYLRESGVRGLDFSPHQEERFTFSGSSLEIQFISLDGFWFYRYEFWLKNTAGSSTCWSSREAFKSHQDAFRSAAQAALNSMASFKGFHSVVQGFSKKLSLRVSDLQQPSFFPEQPASVHAYPAVEEAGAFSFFNDIELDSNPYDDAAESVLHEAWSIGWLNMSHGTIDLEYYSFLVEERDFQSFDIEIS